MKRLLATSLVLLSGAASGCFYSDTYCEAHPSDARFCGAGGAGGATTSTTTTSTSTTTSSESSSSSLTSECDPKKLTQGASIGATCGVFVEPGKTGGDGSQAAPFGTVTEALTANSTNLPVYVCATGMSLAEAVTLTGSEQLFGGLTCGDWKASLGKTNWSAPANAVPLTLSNTTGARVQSFVISALGASGFDPATLQGRSSIAVLADGATATLVDVEAVAGAGATGGDGVDQSGKAPGRQSDAMSFDGHTGGGCNMPGGAAQTYAVCPAGGGTTIGNKGGDGADTFGNAGAPGQPALGGGMLGLGDTGVMGWDCLANGGNGGFGTSGPNGTPGTGGTGKGTLVGATYAGPRGENGSPGGIGQGGGGGGGRKKSIDACSTTGASGGSGGAGGCGGLFGEGGGAGGASIALLSVNATLTLEGVTLTASAGGAGGGGGDGQAGGNGGNGANGGGSACKGGDGGKGGDGAGGGGGKGGPSFGLVSVGVAPSIDDANISVSPAAMGGAAGGGNVPGLVGDAGDTQKKAVFP